MINTKLVGVLSVGCGILFASPTLNLFAGTETVVDRYGHAHFSADSEIAADDALFIPSNAGWVAKTGEGQWTLPLANFLGFYGLGFELGVRGGSVKVTAGTAPDFVTTPPAVLQGAAIWLSADKNVETDPSLDGAVTHWYDAREASMSAGTHLHAEPPSGAGASGVKVTTFAGKPAIIFGQYASDVNKSLLIRNGASGASVQMGDGFYVFGYASGKSFASVLGNTSNGIFFTNPGKGTVLSRDGNAVYTSYQSVFRHNGEVADPTEVQTPDIAHLYEFTPPAGKPITIDSIFRDRALASGGGYLHEFILFTSPLTDVQRAEVSAYLIQKWGVRTGARVAIATQRGSLVELSGVEPAKDVALSGPGAFCAPANSTLRAILDYANREAQMRFRVKGAGDALEVQGTAYGLQIADGDSIEVNDTSSFVRTVSNASGGHAGEATVSGGRRAVVLDHLPATKLKVTNTAGDVILTGANVLSPKYEPGEATTATPGATALSIPAGTGGATTTVTIPAAGNWEFEFDIQNTAKMKPASGSGWTDGKTVSYYVTVKGAGGSAVFNKIVQTIDPSELGGVVPHRRFLLRDIAAGTYTFQVAGYQSSTVAASLSNLAFAFVPQVVRETVVPVVGGDFEINKNMSKPCFASRDNNDGSGWTLSNGGLAVNPCVQTVVNSMMLYQQTTSAGYEFGHRSHELGRYGDNALLWIHTNSTAAARNTAVAKTATVLPAGTWRLRMKACRATTGNSPFNQVDTNPDGNKRCGKYPAVYSASVKVNGGEPIDLGKTDEVSAFAEKTYVYPNTFTVGDDASVILSLDQHVGWSFSLIDDLEFVRVDDAPTLEGDALYGPELVLNGSFETKMSPGSNDDAQDWVRDEYEDGGGKHGARRISPVSSQYYGTTYCDGNYAIRSFNGGCIRQTLLLDEGVYRLSFWNHARCDKSEAGNWNPTYQCKVHFWLASGSQTNVLCDTDTLWCTNFIQRTALFEVKKAGSYDLGFGCDMGKSYDSLTDCVSVRKVLGAVPAPTAEAGAELVVSTPEKVRLDYTGTLDLNRLQVNGQRFYSTVVSAETHPALFAGPGKIHVTGSPKGTIFIVR